mmetsp:Transcript_37378/g.98874  ORF Transcript_37378/g.98874 Transcript_37378/m.98874 type:complete len:357 (-) Transcript_37378:339-1409(-)|eukprot:CAMPEP_0115862946 /NCGR_PEP_ID=MMETSP0287-20121206/18440_1 /TAXON_ID=412157 /ORGANISM="Chrysochromulina rotalis, Strain UIO044" /LENGTH=356 /DNA_ID=CAMNT_0003317387 /DNA_START=31 /DNA_END=1101 /DNA_ORIENTATION=-
MARRGSGLVSACLCVLVSRCASAAVLTCVDAATMRFGVPWRVLHLQRCSSIVASAAASASNNDWSEDSSEDVEAHLELLERCLTLANLESQAEAAEEAQNLAGAIEAYEAILKLSPADAPNLREEDAARRALQQLLLESNRRELAACGDDGCALDEGPPVSSFIKSEIKRAQLMGEEARKVLAMRSLDDVRKIRNSVVQLLQLSEDIAREDAEKARGEQAYLQLVEGTPGFLAGLQFGEATRRRDDARLLRKSVEADLNRLELQLLQGDPSLAFIRQVLRSTRDDDMEFACSQSVWLQEQFETGALPRDPELLRTLLAQARRDPELVARLVTQAKDSRGQDIYTRKKNDKKLFEQF